MLPKPDNDPRAFPWRECRSLFPHRCIGGPVRRLPESGRSANRVLAPVQSPCCDSQTSCIEYLNLRGTGGKCPPDPTVTTDSTIPVPPAKSCICPSEASVFYYPPQFQYPDQCEKYSCRPLVSTDRFHYEVTSGAAAGRHNIFVCWET